MAKKSMVERELKRTQLVEKYAAKRAELKKIISDVNASEEERFEATLKLFAGNQQQFAVFESLDAGGTRLVVDDRHLAEDLAGLAASEDDLLAGVMRRDLDRATLDHERAVATFALSENLCASWKDPAQSRVPHLPSTHRRSYRVAGTVNKSRRAG